MTKDRRFIIRSSLSLQMLAFYYYLKFYVTGKRDNKNGKTDRAQEQAAGHDGQGTR